MTHAAEIDAPTWDQVIAVLRAEHHATVGGNVWWQWSCSCGRSGTPTTQGRAAASKDRHLTAERKKIKSRLTTRVTPPEVRKP